MRTTSRLVAGAAPGLLVVTGCGSSGGQEDAATTPCLRNWPAVTAEVTLGGRPLYTYAADAEAGDVTGQGVQGVWWVVSPDGATVTGPPTTDRSTEPVPVPGY